MGPQVNEQHVFLQWPEISPKGFEHFAKHDQKSCVYNIYITSWNLSLEFRPFGGLTFNKIGQSWLGSRYNINIIIYIYTCPKCSMYEVFTYT